jgi:hypothetical protein
MIGEVEGWMILAAWVLIVWSVAAWVIGTWAEAWGKPRRPYFLSALFLTPLLPAFVLLFKGPEAALMEESAIAEGRMKRCPNCAEAIRLDAITCRFCGAKTAPTPPM